MPAARNQPVSPPARKPAPQGEDLEVLRTLTGKIFRGIATMRFQERTQSQPRQALIEQLEIWIAQLGAACDKQLGYTDPNDPWADEALGVVRVDFAEMTRPGSLYPLPLIKGVDMFEQGRNYAGHVTDWDVYSRMAEERIKNVDDVIASIAPKSIVPPSALVTPDPPEWDDVPHFLRALFAGYDKGWIEMRALSQPRFNKKVVRSWWPLVETLQSPQDFDVSAQLLRDDDYDVYVGVLPRGVSGKSTKADIYEARVFWAELDFDKQPGGEIGTLMKATQGNFDIIVRSGGGVHCYKRLDEAVQLTTENRQRFERAIQKQQSGLGADHTHDITRILRLPGTFNYKLEQQPRRVELIQCP